MPWSGLQSKIFILVISLFSLVLFVTLFSIYSAAKKQAEQQLQASLQVGEKVIANKLELNQSYLESSLETIAKDWALRRAIGEQQDNDSLLAIINNHANRVDSDLVWLFDPKLNLIAKSGELTGSALVPDTIKQLRRQQGIKIMTFAERHYLMAVEPVRAPRVIGWLLIAKEVDGMVLQELGELTQLHISLVQAGQTGIAHILSFSDYGQALRQTLARDHLGASNPDTGLHTLSLPMAMLAINPVLLTHSGTGDYYLLLHENADAVLAPINQFFYDVIPYFLLGVGLAVLGSLAIARGITRPVATLLELAKRVASGNYQEKIRVVDKGELGELATEFCHMQEAVMAREGKIKQQSQELAKASQIKYEAAIARQEKQIAEAATKAKSQFLANMSHEIRTPLNAIIGYSEMLEDEQLSDREKLNASRTVNVCGQHLLSVVNNVLDVSKIEAGKIELEWLETGMVELLEGIKAMVEHAASAKGIAMQLDYQLPLPSEFLADPTRLRQALVNLCNNAIKFTEEGSVTLSASCQDGQLQFAIRDTGIGISQAQQEKLFAAFSQADQSTTRQYGGTGLGLFISKEFAELLGGHISVSSALGTGSTFTITMPLKPTQATEWLAQESQVQSETQGKKRHSVPLLQGHILCADDNADNLRLAEYLIAKTGVELSTVEDGEAAVEAALTTDFDLILMDMQMPKMGGVEATDMLKSAGCIAPIIMLTANVDSDSREQITACGADGYFAKPIDTGKFYQMLQQYLPDSGLPGEDLASFSSSGDGEQQACNAMIDEQAMGELKQSFVAGLDSYLADLDTALQLQDWQQIKSICHQLKGNAPVYGFNELGNLAKAIEANIASGANKVEADSIKPLLTEINRIAASEKI